MDRELEKNLNKKITKKITKKVVSKNKIEIQESAQPLFRIPLKRKGIYLLPNLFTLASLFSGFYGIVAATNGAFFIAAVSIFIAMIFDSLDGRVARLINAQSAFGAD